MKWLSLDDAEPWTEDKLPSPGQHLKHGAHLDMCCVWEPCTCVSFILDILNSDLTTNKTESSDYVYTFISHITKKVNWRKLNFYYKQFKSIVISKTREYCAKKHVNVMKNEKSKRKMKKKIKMLMSFENNNYKD